MSRGILLAHIVHRRWSDSRTVGLYRYPADDEPAGDGWPEGSAVSEGAWGRRRRAAAGVVADCCGVLGAAAVLSLLSRNAFGSAVASGSWRELEAAVTALAAASGELLPRRTGQLRWHPSEI